MVSKEPLQFRGDNFALANNPVQFLDLPVPSVSGPAQFVDAIVAFNFGRGQPPDLLFSHCCHQRQKKR